jgi:hypothetical protein
MTALVKIFLAVSTRSALPRSHPNIAAVDNITKRLLQASEDDSDNIHDCYRKSEYQDAGRTILQAVSKAQAEAANQKLLITKPSRKKTKIFLFLIAGNSSGILKLSSLNDWLKAVKQAPAFHSSSFWAMHYSNKPGPG